MDKPKVEYEQIIEKGCGIDVHKETLTATIRGIGIKETSRVYNTFTSSLLELRNWLKSEGITHIAMESTGVYWKPLFNILEEDFSIILVNARHIKNVPGHKTDKQDSAWISKLLLSGLLKGSYIPPRQIRELRDLCRYKRKQISDISAEKNRLQKILEDANIKLSSVVSDVFGASGTRIIDAIIEGNHSIEELTELCHWSLTGKLDQIKESLNGKITEHHRFMMWTIKKKIEGLEKLIKEVDERIDRQMGDYTLEIELLQTIPGVSKEGAITIISEIGTDMNVFPNEQHLASWAGMSPGNNESAGKKKVVERLTEINI